MTQLVTFLATHPNAVDGPRPSGRDRVLAIWRSFHAWRRLIASRGYLRDLDEHALQDLGISRAQARFEAARKPWDTRPIG